MGDAQTAPAREDASARLNISIQPSIVDEVRRLAAKEDRPLSAMARILMVEGLRGRTGGAKS